MEQTILIVDDSPDGTLLTELALRLIRKDIRTERVASGTAALNYLRDNPELPRMVLLDLKMPGLSGIETLKKIRSEERLKDLPVVIITLSTLDTDMEAAQEAGANGFVHKAIRMHDFTRDLARYVKAWAR